MTGWQPIETAPKDGTKIDIWVPGHDRATAFWSDKLGWVYDEEHIGRTFHPNKPPSFPITATHWMPYPGEPKGIKQ